MPRPDETTPAHRGLSPWLATPRGVDRGPRQVVAESWARSRSRRLDPERLLPELELPEDDIVAYRRDHPLSLLIPVVRSLLLGDVEGSGLLVAVGDERGRLLWVEGDDQAKRAAEGMRFVEGAGWAESRVGTSAPGTALVMDHGIQIRGEEHFNVLVQGWSCTAVPIHDPATRAILGFVDITGDERAVGPQTLPLLQATVAAMEAELTVHRLRARAPGRATASSLRGSETGPAGHSVPRSRVARTAPAPAAALSLLGRDMALLADGRHLVTLTPRHSELVALLSWHTGGVSAEELAHLAYGDPGAVLTLRAEMVRLRRTLEAVDPRLAPLSRPYRMTAPLDSDVARVLALLDRGAHRRALALYSGSILPNSVAPGIEEMRWTLRSRVRESLLEDASADVLMDYATTEEGASDREVLVALLRRLPARSPRRAGLVSRVEALDAL